MNELALFIAIALWCGEPVNPTNAFTTSISVPQVEQCRKELAACLNTKKSITECFEKQECPK